MTLTLWCQHLVCYITTSWILLRFLSFPINTINSTTPPGLVGVHLPNNQQQPHMQELMTPRSSLYSCFLIDMCFMKINRYLSSLTNLMVRLINWRLTLYRVLSNVNLSFAWSSGNTYSHNLKIQKDGWAKYVPSFVSKKIFLHFWMLRVGCISLVELWKR